MKVIVLPRSRMKALVAGVPFPEMGVFFVSREPVRNTEPVRVFAEVRAALKKTFPGDVISGSLSVNVENRFAIASCPAGLGAVAESAISEVYDYDPVRYQAMVIGLVAPPGETPVHWIARRVNPEERIIAVLPTPPALSEGVEVHPYPRGYLGDPNTLMALGRLFKGRAATAVDRVGLVLAATDGVELARELKSSLRPREPLE